MSGVKTLVFLGLPFFFLTGLAVLGILSVMSLATTSSGGMLTEGAKVCELVRFLLCQHRSKSEIISVRFLIALNPLAATALESSAVLKPW